jgi:hypothetical protein
MKQQKYKLLQTTSRRSSWQGTFTNLKEAQRVKRELEQEGVGIFSIVPTDILRKINKDRQKDYERDE